MTGRSRLEKGFTLVELLVVIAVIAILAALLFPAFSAAKGKARRAVCLNHLKQINLGMRLYWDEHNDFPPGETNTPAFPIRYWTGYKKLMKSYVGLSRASSARDTLFACPADTFYYDFIFKTNHPYYTAQAFHEQPVSDFSSYFSNAGALTTAPNAPGLKGRKISLVKHPALTVLVAEMPAFAPYSWHHPKRPPRDANETPTFNNSRNMVGFVDGHVNYIKIHWSRELFYARGYSFAMGYDPPAGYEYQWSGD